MTDKLLQCILYVYNYPTIMTDTTPITEENTQPEIVSEPEIEVTEHQELQNKITQLEKQLSEQQEITKKAQYDYVNLKMDFDALHRRSQEQIKNADVDSLVKVVRKFLPFFEDLRKALDNIPSEQQDTSIVQGVRLVYQKFLQALESMSIKPIVSVGLVPDSLLHEPVSMQPVEDEAMKGKIVQELQQGFVYEKDDNKIVIVSAKVVVGG